MREFSTGRGSPSANNWHMGSLVVKGTTIYQFGFFFRLRCLSVVVNSYVSLFRVPSSLHLQPSPSFPWMNIGITEYWMHCRDSVLSCAPKSDGLKFCTNCLTQ